MFTSIRAKLGIIFFGFLMLGAGSVTATFMTIQAQATDAMVINLAGRQRMLTQEMTKAVLGIARDPASDYLVELDESAYLFDATLTSLLEGGSAPYGDSTITLPPTIDLNIRTQLGTATELWDRFRQEIETVQTADPESAAFVQAVDEIESLSLVILQEMDRVVRLYEAAAESKLARLRLIQTTFAISAVGLLIAGYITTQRTIAAPISALEAATRRIASGDLESLIEVMPTAGDEVRTLAQSFEDMRHDLAASRLELARWATELESRVERRTEQLTILFDVSAEVSSKLEIQQVLELVTEKSRHLAEAEIAVLCLLDPSDEALTVAAVSGPTEALTTDLGSVIQATTLSGDCDCHFLSPQFRHSHLTVPLRIGERTLGVLYVGHRTESHFGKEEARLLTLLANAGAVALENARLYGRVEQAATLMERERIVAEIHDGLGQTLGFMALRLDAVAGLIKNENIAEHLSLMQRTVEQANSEVRRLLTNLRAGPQLDHTLGELLKQTVERFSEEHGIEIDLQTETGQPIREPPQVHEQVVRVVLEALTNAYKHAKINRTTVTLERQDGQAVIHVQDNGIGFDADSQTDEPQHFGLKVMQTRAERIGGELNIESALDQGTTVTLRWDTKR